MKIYDLTVPITTDLPIFPGDPEVVIEQIHSLEKGNTYNLCALRFGNHTGTHIDYPSHVLKNSKSSSDYQLADHIGSGIIIEIPENTTQLGITDVFIREQKIDKHDIVFFKTSNSKLPKTQLLKSFVYLTPEGARELAKKEVKIVGIDYMSIDAYEDENLSSHKILLQNSILIVENLDLSLIPAGRYESINIIPLSIPQLDGLPVRVFVSC